VSLPGGIVNGVFGRDDPVRGMDCESNLSDALPVGPVFPPRLDMIEIKVVIASRGLAPTRAKKLGAEARKAGVAVT
jgi:hypothetical protein